MATWPEMALSCPAPQLLYSLHAYATVPQNAGWALRFGVAWPLRATPVPTKDELEVVPPAGRIPRHL